MAPRAAFLAALLLCVPSCFFPAASELPRRVDARREEPSYEYADVRLLEAFSTASDEPYRLGAGDVLDIVVWGHGNLSGEHTVGPDGRVTLPVLGSFDCRGLTRDEASARIGEQLLPYYRNAAVTVRVLDYAGNRISVLGGVVNPGVFTFTHRPTLVEALSRAGGVQTLLSGASPTRCSIQRGGNQLVWIDLRELLWNGRTELNVTLRADDMVFVPDMDDEVVYVMGEVLRPGNYRLGNDMTLVDALTVAGGATVNAEIEDARIFRLEDGVREVVDYHDVEAGAHGLDVPLERFDIIVVPRRGLAKWNYFWTRINPFSGLFSGGV